MLLKQTFSLMVAAVMMVAGLQLSAQTTPSNDKIIYMELSQLTVDTYPTLFDALKNHSDFELVESCVPAHIISIRIKNNNLSTNSAITSIDQFLEGIGFADTEGLEGFDDTAFMNRCRASRTGN